MPRQYNRRLAIRVIGPSIAYIPLTRGAFALIDAEDADRADEFTWFAHLHHTGNLYAVANTKGKSRTGIKLNRWLMDAVDGLFVDHINGNTLDNRRSCNLRYATRSQSSMNTKTRKDNAVGLKGICRSEGYWLVQIASNKRRFKRRCKSIEEAVIVRNMLQAALHGSYARRVSDDPNAVPAPKP